MAKYPKIGELYKQSPGYPKPQQPGGQGSPVTQPVQPSSPPVYTQPPYTSATNPTPFNERSAFFFPGCNHCIREWEIIFDTALGPEQSQLGSASSFSGWVAPPAVFTTGPLVEVFGGAGGSVGSPISYGPTSGGASFTYAPITGSYLYFMIAFQNPHTVATITDSHYTWTPIFTGPGFWFGYRVLGSDFTNATITWSSDSGPAFNSQYFMGEVQQGSGSLQVGTITAAFTSTHTGTGTAADMTTNGNTQSVSIASTSITSWVSANLQIIGTLRSVWIGGVSIPSSNGSPTNAGGWVIQHGLNGHPLEYWGYSGS